MKFPRQAIPVVCLLPALAAAGHSRADIDPQSGIDFVRIGAPGNAPWSGTTPPTIGDMALGRGQVNYEYQIGRLEVTTSQWAEFFSAALDRPANDRLPWIAAPTFWGAVGTAPTTPGGQRFAVPAGNEMRAVGNISWRVAAMYCNWLHNGKSTDRDAFMNGAYDVSQFSGIERFTDQLTHNAGAKYWIPTWDEWLKAAHYDPDKNGPDQGGWWTYSNGTDQQLIGGPPGVGQANFGWRDGANSQWTTLLGAYPDTQSPWGLLDVAGGTAEWTEGVLFGAGDTKYRVYEGSYWGSSPGFAISDAAFSAGGASFPSIDFLDLGFRIATTVPNPPSASVLIASLLLLSRRRRHVQQSVDSHGGGGV